MDFALDECTLTTPEGTVCQVKIKHLHPTQNAVGFDEVHEKMSRIRHKSASQLRHYLQARPVPVIVGNGGKCYLVDHHHMTNAVWKVAHQDNHAKLRPDNVRVIVNVVGNWHDLRDYHFWKRMFEARRVYLFNEYGGGPIRPSDLIKHIKDLRNDAYRSLAWLVRKRGGYTKSSAPFAEFHWAEFFRTRVMIDHHILQNKSRAIDVLIQDLHEEERTQLIESAMALARSPEAAGLPGFIGDGAAEPRREYG